MKIQKEKNQCEKWYLSVDHISEDPDFQELPLHSFILKSCGDGLSSLALENRQDTLLLVSNVVLVTSKVRQYVNSQFDDVPNTEYAARQRYSGEVFGVWKGVRIKDVRAYVTRCRKAETPVKIICTYDSLFKLTTLLDEFEVIAIDEADMLQEYAQLKANTRAKAEKHDAITRLYEMAEANQERVVFFSATTMGDAYLPDWVNNFRKIRIITPNIVQPVPMLMKRINPWSALKQEIILPIMQNGSVTIGDRTFSRCILLMNSVQQAMKIIRECELPEDRVGVICGDSHKNTFTTQGKYRNADLNHIPQFLFITSSGWRGVDIHDREAMSIVISSTSKSYHMVSADTQLLQAVRRQRDKQNPNYDRFIFIYDTSHFDHTEDELLEAWLLQHSRFSSNVDLLNQLLAEGKQDEYQHTIETFNRDRDFSRFINFEEGKGLVLNENLYKAVLHRILVVRRSYTTNSKQPVEKLLPVEPIVIPPPAGGDPCSFTTLIQLFRKQQKGEPVGFTPEQLNSDNYHVIERYAAVFGSLPRRLDTARQKLYYAADNQPVQYVIDMVSPLQKGHRYKSQFILQHMKSLFRRYGLPEKTDMPTIIAVLQENGIKLKRIKSSTIYYEVLGDPTGS